MNIVYQSERLTVVDDRDFISPEDAFEILWSGKTIQVCDPPDYGAENEFDIYSHLFTMRLNDCLEDKLIAQLSTITKEEIRQNVIAYLIGYELSE